MTVTKNARSSQHSPFKMLKVLSDKFISAKQVVPGEKAFWDQVINLQWPTWHKHQVIPGLNQITHWTICSLSILSCWMVSKKILSGIIYSINNYTPMYTLANFLLKNSLLFISSKPKIPSNKTELKGWFEIIIGMNIVWNNFFCRFVVIFNCYIFIFLATEFQCSRVFVINNS